EQFLFLSVQRTIYRPEYQPELQHLLRHYGARHELQRPGKYGSIPCWPDSSPRAWRPANSDPRHDEFVGIRRLLRSESRQREMVGDLRSRRGADCSVVV